MSTHRLIQTAQETLCVGTTEACNNANLYEGWTAIDVERHQLRVYDGITPGGHTILNEVDIDTKIATALDGVEGGSSSVPTSLYGVYGSGRCVATGAELSLQTKGNRAAFWGSSTLSMGADSACNAVTFDGFISTLCTQTQMGPIIVPVYNGAIGGSTSAAISTKFTSEVDSHTYDIAFLQFGGNDLITSIDATSIIGFATSAINKCLKRGKRIILVVPYSRNMGESTVGRNLYSEWCLKMSERFAGYVGVIDMFSVLSKPYPSEITPAGYLDTSGVHLVYEGYVACLPEMCRALSLIFGEYTPDENTIPGATIIGFTTFSARAVVNCAKVLNRVDETGRNVYRATPTNPATLSTIYGTTSLVEGKKYVMIADIVAVTSGVGRFGIYARSQDNSTLLSRGTETEQEVFSFAVGMRRRYMMPFTATLAMAIGAPSYGIRFTGVTLDISELTLIQLD